MDLSELRARVRRLSGIRSTAILSDADVDATINEVYREIAGVAEWPFLYLDATVATVAGTERVTIPAARSITSVYVSSPVDSSLSQVAPEQLDGLPVDETGEPSVFARVADGAGIEQLLLWPTPDAVYTISVRGIGDVTTLTENDSPAWAVEFHPMVAYAAAARVLAEEGDDSGRADMYGSEVAAALGRMRTRYFAVQDRRLFQMGGRDRRLLAGG